MRFLKQDLALWAILIAGFTALAWTGSRMVDAVAVFADNQLGPNTTIVIDAGHGGEDGGTVSCTGVWESQINLEISHRLDALLQLTGYRTQMLRREDISLHSPEASSYSEKKVSDLKNRLTAIGDVQNPLVVSIHQNHFPQEKYRGAQVFYSADGRFLAELTQEMLRTALDQTNHRQIKPATGIYLMEHLPCAGILVECGFLSNPAEEALLRDAAYQQKIAGAIAAALGEYLSENQGI